MRLIQLCKTLPRPMTDLLAEITCQCFDQFGHVIARDADVLIDGRESGEPVVPNAAVLGYNLNDAVERR